jgi:hypothetical protein
MFRENNGLSHDIFPVMFEGHLRKALWFLYAATLITINLGISKNVSMKRLTSEGVNTKRTVSPYLCSL